MIESDVSLLRHRFETIWARGRNQLLAWNLEGGALVVVHCASHALPDVVRRFANVLRQKRRARPGMDVADLLGAGCSIETIVVPKQVQRAPDLEPVVDELIRRYSVTRTDARAVALFDIVRFSIAPALEQVTLINSLAYSLNGAHARCKELGIDIDLAMSTTGDGFYVWNRNKGIQADLALYILVSLALVDNAAARAQDRRRRVPRLRACFSIGSQYKFFQELDRRRHAREFIVGDVTISLARLIAAALPGQVLIGDFVREFGAGDAAFRDATDGLPIATPLFVAMAQGGFSRIKGLQVSGAPIEEIRNYLTGQPQEHNAFSISRYGIVDKHEIMHRAYNAKINVRRTAAAPLHVGLQHHDLAAFQAVHLAEEDIELRLL